MADCLTMLSSVLHNEQLVFSLLPKPEIVAGCLQAAEAEHAARIQAAASRQAGWWTLGAGILALAAGILAYYSAREQYRAAERQRYARQAAYAGQILALSSRASRELLEVRELLLAKSEGRSADLNTRDVTGLQTLYDELKPLKWENHALLGPDAVHLITNSFDDIYAGVLALELYFKDQLSGFLTYSSTIDALDTAEQACEKLITVVALKTSANPASPQPRRALGQPGGIHI